MYCQVRDKAKFLAVDGSGGRWGGCFIGDLFSMACRFMYSNGGKTWTYQAFDDPVCSTGKLSNRFCIGSWRPIRCIPFWCSPTCTWCLAWRSIAPPSSPSFSARNASWRRSASPVSSRCPAWRIAAPNTSPIIWKRYDRFQSLFKMSDSYQTNALIFPRRNRTSTSLEATKAT